ncbi:hypothetical protein GSI_13561 [Ganoderma sinense ZZ0214-1]|uniref:SRR1-like domain-containing protein n=1 Tax=Ganoderma sinense ZZ0214-1 TaxID=1077348 RepID=A0A2G8RQL5_9APHY|nr:hypothetical protein GSI_13561 [Ganoderma sinense ZZ0214-1]
MSRGESEPQFGYEDHFTPARTRKKRKNRPPAESPSPTLLLERASEELARIDWLRDAQQALRETLQEAFAFNAGAAPDVLCLGLGSPSSSRDARAQLAFLLAVCDDLRIARTNVSIFDPVFTEQDHQLLTQLGLTELPENRMAHHRLESPTIAFMPHCDLHLYDNLFRENWSREQLPRVLLIANRLSEYAEKYVRSLPRVPPRGSRVPILFLLFLRQASTRTVPAAWHVPSLPFPMSASVDVRHCLR